MKLSIPGLATVIEFTREEPPDTDCILQLKCQSGVEHFSGMRETLVHIYAFGRSLSIHTFTRVGEGVP